MRCLSKKHQKQGDEHGGEIPLPNPDEGTIICGVVRHLGGDYLIAKCLDGVDRKIRIPGKLRRKVWITEGDIILVGLWDFSTEKGEVVYKYGKNEVNKLVEKGVVPKEFIDALSELI
ncbi:translation initiation factor aIF-1A [Desulfurococcus amylolyticus]|uniref:translation initiation factor aIF-1A n=1 Tax=Desulfurococcus amylolyticus TaxID=94694 RepID=UPI0005B20864|nr:translation initiation factor aIF-1A [Desulfurococcus amylolyticus]